MQTAFAIIKLPVNVVDKDGKIIGQQHRDITKAFPADATLNDIAEWARSKQANGCTIWFETPEDPA